ncbi:putative entry exclusion protein TrbK-alt [Xanthobacter autotrophicus]|uniref:putative entry exclusion protein TrbK-alt n=1 Tax=Xanthobacter autotrophicus TaxID=280 RepID=UPI00372A9941
MDRLEVTLITAILIAGLFVAVAMTGDRRADTLALTGGAPQARSPDLSAALQRCKALTPEDGENPRCRAAWEQNRRRFFGKPTLSPSEGAAP